MYLIDYIYANPAEAGRKNCFIAHLSDIHQWIGIKNAPNLQTLTAHKGYKKEHRKTYHGLGGLVYRDQNGHYGNMGIKAIYSFHILLNEKKKTYLSMGLAGEYTQRTLDENGFLNYNSDPALSGSGRTTWNPNADFGIILSNKALSFGFAVIDLFPAMKTISDPVISESQSRKYSLYLSKYIPVNHSVAIEPAFMFKANELLFTQADFSTKILINDLYWLGFSYRHAADAFPGKPLSVLIYAGINIHRWSIDYSFTYNMSTIQKYQYGSHGIIISYKICSNERGAVPCPAYK